LRDEAAAFAYLFARHLTERFSITPNRAEKNDKILHAACGTPRRQSARALPGK